MTSGWFQGLESTEPEAAARAVRTGQSATVEPWPALAVEHGVVSDRAAYYDQLHEATTAAAAAAASERQRADDNQIVHAVRAMDDCERTANELAERLSEWAGSRYKETGSGVEYARELLDTGTSDGDGARIQALAAQVDSLATEAAALRERLERTAPDVAPNLTNLAGPVLTARLLDLAGGLEALAKVPSGTVQVLGAEEALFAHLRGNAPSPKHGVIYTHEAISGTRPEDRGSAARALAGKLSIAARVDHYSGDLRPELAVELESRIATIQAREDGGQDG
jgi:nucleolar protein 56